MPGLTASQQFKQQQESRRVHEPLVRPIREAAARLIPTGGLNFSPSSPAQRSQGLALNEYSQSGAAPPSKTGAGQMAAVPTPPALSLGMRALPSPPPMASPGPAPSISDQQYGRPQAMPSAPVPQQPAMPSLPPSPFQGRQVAPPSIQPPAPIDNMQGVADRNAFRDKYWQAQLGGLFDAGTEIANNTRFAQNVTPPPFNPLDRPISGPGIYGQAVNAGGLMNNTEAQQFQRNVGYMPNRTVGGAFGAPGSQPLDIERAPKTGAQIDSYLGQNPGGRFFQGAQAGMVSSPGGGQRAGFLSAGGPLPKNEEAADQANAKMVSRGYTNQGGQLVGTPTSATRAAQEVFDARRGGVEARRKAYEEKVAGNAAERKAGVKENANQRAEARRARRGLFSNEEQIARANPAAYQARQAEGERAKAFAANAAADRGVRERLGLAAVEQRDRSDDTRLRISRNEAGLPEGGKAEAKLPKLKSAPDLPPEVSDQVRETAIKNPEAARPLLAQSGVTSKAEQDKILREATGNEDIGLSTSEKLVKKHPTGLSGPNTRSEVVTVKRGEKPPSMAELSLAPLLGPEAARWLFRGRSEEKPRLNRN